MSACSEDVLSNFYSIIQRFGRTGARIAVEIMVPKINAAILAVSTLNGWCQKVCEFTLPEQLRNSKDLKELPNMYERFS